MSARAAPPVSTTPASTAPASIPPCSRRAALIARPLVVAGLCAAAWLAPWPATAQVQATGEYLQRMDADGDGKVSLAEYQDWLSYAFDRMDRDRDGVLSPHEQPGGRGAALTREAHRARVADMFKRQDRNRDGALDARELAAPPQGR